MSLGYLCIGHRFRLSSFLLFLARFNTFAIILFFYPENPDEQHLRDRIVQLQEWRSNGITTKKAGDQYEKDKQSRVSIFGFGDLRRDCFGRSFCCRVGKV